MNQEDRVGRIDADEETGELPSAIEALMDLIPKHASVVITGAWVDSTITQIQEALRKSGRKVDVHHSALTSADVDPDVVAHVIDEELLDHLPEFFAA